jgi:hypothetical protein
LLLLMQAPAAAVEAAAAVGPSSEALRPPPSESKAAPPPLSPRNAPGGGGGGEDGAEPRAVEALPFLSSTAVVAVGDIMATDEEDLLCVAVATTQPAAPFCGLLRCKFPPLRRRPSSEGPMRSSSAEKTGKRLLSSLVV